MVLIVEITAANTITYLSCYVSYTLIPHILVADSSLQPPSKNRQLITIKASEISNKLANFCLIIFSFTLITFFIFSSFSAYYHFLNKKVFYSSAHLVKSTEEKNKEEL